MYIESACTERGEPKDLQLQVCQKKIKKSQIL